MRFGITIILNMNPINNYIFSSYNNQVVIWINRIYF